MLITSRRPNRRRLMATCSSPMPTSSWRTSPIIWYAFPSPAMNESQRTHQPNLIRQGLAHLDKIKKPCPDELQMANKLFVELNCNSALGGVKLKKYKKAIFRATEVRVSLHRSNAISPFMAHKQSRRSSASKMRKAKGAGDNGKIRSRHAGSSAWVDAVRPSRGSTSTTKRKRISNGCSTSQPAFLISNAMRDCSCVSSRTLDDVTTRAWAPSTPRCWHERLAKLQFQTSDLGESSG